MMTEDERSLIKAVSFLLGYPDARWKESLDSIEEILEDLSCSRTADMLLDAVSTLRCKPLLQLQEEYTRLFDLNPSTSLNLTYHKWGDRKERGHALACLKQAYTKAGLSPMGGELPDYLPLVLEFLSVCPADAFLLMIEEYEGVLKDLASRLDDVGSVYACCLKAFLELIAGPRQSSTGKSPAPLSSSSKESTDFRRTES